MSKSKTISILICALNEEKNIGFLLQDVLDQKFDKKFTESFELQNIIVVSDGSTDRTVEIVQDFKKKDARVNIIVNEKRIGKTYSLDKAFKKIETDYVVLFDADVRLKNSTISSLVKPLNKNNYDLIGGNPIPFKPKSLFNVAEQASFFSWLILQEIKKENPNSIYCAHGRILLISKKLYKNLDINQSSTPGDDQYIYLKSNHNFCYEKGAIVFYFMPGLIGDYLKQNVRFRKAKLTRLESSFGKEFIKNEFKICNKKMILVKTILRNPWRGILWLSLYLSGYLKFKIQVQDSKDINKIWGEVKSTK